MQTGTVDKKLTVVIVDDEERASDALRLMLEKFVPQADDIIVCNDARQAASVITQRQPNLVFLDIKMPHLSGFEVLQQIPNQSFKIIFTTAYNEFAIKAIRFSAFDYLLKPVDVEELIDTVNRFLMGQAEAVSSGPLLHNMLQNMQSASSHFRLAIPAKEGTLFLSPADIIYCEALSNYTRFYIQNSSPLVTSKNLGEYEDLLEPYHFIRCHKSYLVNKDFISYADHEGSLVLKNGSRLEVSKRRKSEVMRSLKN